MEILELLFVLVQFLDVCACFLEVAALGANGASAYTGYRTFQKRKKITEHNLHHHGAPLKKPSVWPFVVLLIIAIGLTVLVVVKYSRMGW
jgi:hypothetical protein